MKTDRPVLFYDQDCRFCRASAQAIAKLDRGQRFAMLPFADPLADEMLAKIPQGDRARSIHVVQPDGWVVSAGDALIELTRAFPCGDRIANSAWRNERLRGIFRWGYQLVADRRGSLSRFVPNYAAPIRRPHAA